MQPNLILYKFETCPFCQKVMDYLAESGISVEMKDTRQTPEFQDELIQIGGKSQVPCLVIDGAALYESNDIIQWFEQHYVRQN